MKKCPDLSDIEAEMHYIAVLNDIILAFQTELSRFLHLDFTAVCEKILTVVDLRTDETFFEIRMDYSGTAGSLVSKSVWIIPAQRGALSPSWKVQALSSSLPAVKKVLRPSVL